MHDTKDPTSHTNLIGILALQGGYTAHANKLSQLDAKWQLVRTPDDLNQVNALIIPGGESTTMLNLLAKHHLFSPLSNFAKTGCPILGTCAGAILMAKQVLGRQQPTLNLIDITISRNAYGRQLQSHVSTGTWMSDKTNLEMLYIRAPMIEKTGPDVSVLATDDNIPTCVQQDNYLVTTFHPELSDDDRIYRHFLFGHL